MQGGGVGGLPYKNDGGHHTFMGLEIRNLAPLVPSRKGLS